MVGSFCTNVAVNLVSKLGEYLFVPIGRQFGYMLCYKSYVEDLKNEVKELERARERVQHSVDEARNDAKPIYTDVEDWLGRVTKEAEEAQNLLERDKSAKNACFRGWIPNPVVRHPIGRKVKETTEVILGLLEKSRNSNFKKVYYENTPSGIVPGTTSTTRSVDKEEDPLESRPSIIDDVMKAIADDKIHVIGVYGPGGVGKSKLLEDIEKRVKQEKLFDVVVVANVSRNPDLKIIQGEITDALGLKLMNVETARGRANRLRERLERDHDKNILIILDNLWKKLELKDVGIPCRDDNKVKGCKLVLTSRSKDLLCIDMGSDQEFRVNELKHGEARRLFERTMGDKINDLEFKSLVDGVVEKCGGLPLFIVSLAKKLKHGDLATWRNALNIEGSNLKSHWERNYEDINDERIKSVFLVCALHSRRTCLRDSLVYCMGLGLYEKFNKTIEDARDRLRMDLHSLQDSCLLLDSDEKEWIRMHDIIVDVAISIASTEWKALVGTKGDGLKKWSEDELKKCTAISLRHVGIEELTEKLDCPNLKMLLLLEHNPFLKIPPSFFESMRKLQVLDITGLSFTSLPSSIELLENLKSLCLDRCHLGDVTILGKLKGLQMLSFLHSTITFLPKEIGGLTKLRFLDLTGCTELKVIEPGVLESLANLEELYMGDSFDQWEAEDEAVQKNVSLAELKNMKNLSTLYIAIPRWVNLLRDLPFGKLNKHIIQIGEVWDGLGEYKVSRTLKLKPDSGNLLHEEWVQKCLQRTQDLRLDGLQDGNNSVHDLCVEGFQELKHLHIQNSPSLQYVVHSEEDVQCIAFTRLVSFFLENLNNLKKICCGHLALESFGKLKIVKVDNCGEIKHLFPLSMMRILSQLEEIEISRCHLMQQIVANAEAEDGDEIDEDPKVRSYNLRRLTLRNLPKMTSFYKNADQSIDLFDAQQLMKLQCLEAITIERCQLIREVFDLEGLMDSGEVEILSQLRELTLIDLPSLGHIWNKNPQRASYFRNLRTLKVQNCENLRFLFSSSMAKALGQIKEIEIESCELMEEIIDVQEEELEEAATTDPLEFPLLTSLSLVKLPNLKRFFCGKHSIHYPSLTRLTISQCPRMMTFSSFNGRQQSMTAGTSLEQLSGHINSGLSLPSFFNEKVLFPSLEELKLSFMGQLKRIWHNQIHGLSFCKLASLSIKFCENLSQVFPSNLMDRLQSLNEIEVVSCPSLEALFESASLSSEKRQKTLVLSAFKKMKLSDLPSLRDILKSDCKITLAFPSLMEVNVRCCHSLPYLFSSATAKTLDKLAAVDISYCNNLQGIIAMEEGKGKTVNKFKFRNLTTLKLRDLENLICFNSESCDGNGLHPLFDKKVQFPAIESMEISQMPNVEKIWIDELASDAFSKLKTLRVEYCKKLASIFSSDTILARFRKLEILSVTDCDSLEVIFLVEEKNMSKAPITSSFLLRELNLERLPKLKHVWSGHPGGTLKFECLRCFKATKCESLQSLFPSSVAKSMTQLEQLLVTSCGMEEIIAEEDGAGTSEGGDLFFPRLTELTLEELPELRSFHKNMSIWPLLPALFHAEKVAFPAIESMEISQIPNVQKIWGDELASDAFNKLETLRVDHCEKLTSIFSSDTILARFHNLKELTVTDCGSLEMLFPIKEINISTAPPTSSFLLRELKLKRLPKLKHLWSGHPGGTLKFECLECFKATECESLQSLFPSSVAKSMTQLEQLLVTSCGMEEIIAEEDGAGTREGGDLFFPGLTELTLVKLPELRSFYKNTSIWPLLPALFHAEKVAFPAIESMEISQIPNVQKIWGDELASDAFNKLETLRVDHCEKLTSIFSSDTILARFHNLKELTVTDCGSLEMLFPIKEINISTAPPTSSFLLRELKLKRLPKLKHLWSGHPGGTLKFECLECFKATECESLQSLFPSSVAKSMTHLEQLLVTSCGVEEIIAEEDGVDMSANDLFFPQLTDLRLLGLPNLRSFYRSSHTSTWPILKQLRVRHCCKMRSFSFAGLIQSCHGSTTSDQRALFSFEKVITNLKGLTLTREDIMMMMQQHYIFGNLKELELACYHDENVAFPSDFLLHRFPNLEVLSLSCSSLEEIFPKDVFGHGGATPYGELIDLETPLGALRNLTRLELNKLCKLQRVWKDGSLMVEILKQIESLLVSECSSLSIVFPSPTTFQGLTELEVKGCTGLIHMGTCSAMPSLVHLARLILRDCDNMEDVVTNDGNEVKEISFPELDELILDGLPSLESFSSTNCAFKFPSLGLIIVKQCPKMKIFCNGALSTPFLDEVFFSDKGDKACWEGDLNTTIKSLSMLNNPHCIQ
ncbi:hypothetical protein BT93_B0820 [Corymbia citriodora subsp. variegata]|nr:hypothetical protein BT93_B0820 [Corymbia citriodora subsp. variegata]